MFTILRHTHTHQTHTHMQLTIKFKRIFMEVTHFSHRELGSYSSFLIPTKKLTSLINKFLDLFIIEDSKETAAS